jgi:serine/threonine-protein kinase HSL1 (negative regulator of Swe1 kinase)
LAAVKILPKGELEKQRYAVEREIVMMKLMDHPNVLNLYDVWEGRNDLCVLFCWLSFGH